MLVTFTPLFLSSKPFTMINDEEEEINSEEDEINREYEADEDEEIFLDEGDDYVEPLKEFHSFYVITKQDGSAPEQYNVTIKGEMPEEGSQIGYYNVIYSDGSTKVIDWQPGGVGWIERGIGKTAHSMSIGSLIEKHFGPDED